MPLWPLDLSQIRSPRASSATGSIPNTGNAPPDSPLRVCSFSIVRSHFRAKHHVVVQCMARWLKCPLPPPPPPGLETSPAWTSPDKEDKEELTTLPTPQGTSHCSCLEHCFLFYEQKTIFFASEWELYCLQKLYNGRVRFARAAGRPGLEMEWNQPCGLRSPSIRKSNTPSDIFSHYERKSSWSLQNGCFRNVIFRTLSTAPA